MHAWKAHSDCKMHSHHVMTVCEASELLFHTFQFSDCIVSEHKNGPLYLFLTHVPYLILGSFQSIIFVHHRFFVSGVNNENDGTSGS